MVPLKSAFVTFKALTGLLLLTRLPRIMRKLHIGIIGAGGIVLQRHLPALLEMPDVEIVAVSNSSYESSVRFCDTHLPHATPMKNWADLVALPDLDIIWIGTQPYMHAPICISALEAGRHVFCQARMAMNAAEAEEMLQAAQKRPHLVTMLCPPPMGMRGDLVMHQLLRERFIGEPTSIRLRSLNSSFIDASAPAHWRQKIELSGCNVLTLGIYVEVLQRWLGRISAVTARSKTVHPLRGLYEVRIPDLVNVLAEFESGAEGVLEFSGVSPFAPTDQLEIYGEHGAIHYDLASEQIKMGRVGDQSLRDYPVPPELVREWTVEHDFIHAVRNPGLPRPRPSFEDGLAYMQVVEAVAESARSQRRVEIPG